ncbi:DedA family protein [Desulfofundulus thermobenzoicus]|uniref:DedA family protein n=1 Tax=Desulfofundulus thermobenzoicus TaxID=29376 RepID=A0A6N7IR18_9FIRM|nr:DedA family protein [Desulfofundulus thermobenzoicus]MQL52033.1 DedA family protein [Desulfofundulus thermobenzoicus]HHW42287.1 DedA family protein [Desulfotomaculum sp.]
MKEWILHYLGTLGAGGVFLGLIIEALGFPFPGGLMILLSGMLVNQGKLNFLRILGAAVLGFNLGAVMAYFIGRYAGDSFILRYGRYLRVTPARFERARSWLCHSAPAFIILGRFVPMVSNLTPYMAGISGLSLIRFLVYNSIFVISWASLNLGIGILFGHHWEEISAMVQSRLPLMAAGGLVFYLVFLYLRRQRKAPQQT